MASRTWLGGGHMKPPFGRGSDFATRRQDQTWQRRSGLSPSPPWNLPRAVRFPPDREGHAGPEADIGWEGLLKLRSGCPPHVRRTRWQSEPRGTDPSNRQRIRPRPEQAATFAGPRLSRPSSAPLGANASTAVSTARWVVRRGSPHEPTGRVLRRWRRSPPLRAP